MLATIADIITTRIGKYLAAIGLVFATFFAVWAKGRSAGTASARAAAMQAEIGAAKERANADNMANRSPDPVDELRKNWTRH